jgi:aldose 1-epimerase
MIRKHVKVEPDRWYYHCDKMGFLVWQDMPSGNPVSQDDRTQFRWEMKAMVDQLFNHPSIVMWVPFNEGWGQHDTRRITDWLHTTDPTRLVNSASGWTDRGTGDVWDVHDYPGPRLGPADGRRARVLGEFGGLGLPLEAHTWLGRNNWGYRSYTSLDSLRAAYRALLGRLRPLVDSGLAAAVYTQTTDVEIEVNGVMTYDRAVVKLPDDAPALHAQLTGALAAAGRSRPMTNPGIRQEPFGRTPDGQDVELFTFTNAHGMEARVMTYGGILVSLKVPDRDGRLGDVVLGHDSLAGYLRGNTAYFGAIVGRYANRIAAARFTLDGRTYELAANNGPNTLHGGRRGFDQRVWWGMPFQRDGTTGVTMTYTSPDGEEGYPGALTVRVTYSLTERNELIVDYEATTDRATPVNLTQHSYFNLRGEGDVLGHVLTIDASRFTPVDAGLIPTGSPAPVEGTPFDFRRPVPIGARIADDDPQLRLSRGYDHNFVLDRPGSALARAARLEEPVSGRTLEVRTTEPGLQFYSGNFLDGSVTGKGGRPYTHRAGLCLETQHFPDSPNRPDFPSTILRPGETLRSQTVFAFGVMR